MSWGGATDWPGRPGTTASSFGGATWESKAPGGPRRQGSERVLPSILLVIGVQIVLQVALAVWMIASEAEPDTIVRVILTGTLGYYGLVALYVMWRFAGKEITPVWSSRNTGVSALVGAGVGLGMVLPIAALLSLISGRLSSDTFTVLLASERSLARVIAGAVLLSICAPLVEEWLFRGLLAESLVSRGRWAALLVSSVMFALWHLRFAATQYYIVVGLVLCALYLRRGLVASITAHAVFNGTLLVLAVIAAHGPMHTIRTEELSLRVPAAWYESDVVTDVDELGLDLQAEPSPYEELNIRGPTRALLTIFHVDGPQMRADANALARVLRNPSFDPELGELEIDRSTVFTTAFPAGPAVRALGNMDGRRAEVVFFPREGRVWTLLLKTAGSYRAAKDFEEILPSVRLG